MNGIYIHIPYCKSKCHYCDFYSVVNNQDKSIFQEILIRELVYRFDYLIDKQIDTIYFGGGTPSLLPESVPAAILDEITKRFTLAPEAEITLEANPDDLTAERLAQWKSSGINRLSMGIQSFYDEHLTLMNRRHTAEEGEKAVYLAANAGFEEISIDLIYGIPGLTVEQWESNLLKASSLPVNHISSYHLTFEPGTRFSILKKQGILRELPDEASFSQYLQLLDTLEANDFRQYEISNFARKGAISKHNSKYWKGEPYLGLGPSAHSYNGFERHWNPSNLAQWKAQVNGSILPKGEILTPQMIRNEFIMTRLRTDEGIDIEEYNLIFGRDEQQWILEASKKHIQNDDLCIREGRLLFNRTAWFRSDGILADLFRV